MNAVGMWTVCWIPDFHRFAAMREDRRNYSLPTLHECVHEQETQRARANTAMMVQSSDELVPTAISYKDMKLFGRKAGSRLGLIGRRHTFTAQPPIDVTQFEHRARRHTYHVQVRLRHCSAWFVKNPSVLF